MRSVPDASLLLQKLQQLPVNRIQNLLNLVLVLCLAWLLTRGEHVLPIPGTTSLAHLEENVGALELVLSEETLGKLNELINPNTVQGPRYPAATQQEIDTEEFA